MKDDPQRSIIKSISWRFLASSTTIIVALIFTKEIVLSLKIGAVEAFLKIVIYYAHERLWNKVNWGQSPNGR
jgi:uncharacterized membrane protein